MASPSTHNLPLVSTHLDLILRYGIGWDRTVNLVCVNMIQGEEFVSVHTINFKIPPSAEFTSKKANRLIILFTDHCDRQEDTGHIQGTACHETSSTSATTVRVDRGWGEDREAVGNEPCPRPEETRSRLPGCTGHSLGTVCLASSSTWRSCPHMGRKDKEGVNRRLLHQGPP
ncbi:hypothetical protein BaRGS_00027124 [Batillaria attramentaria]|uniref:Uncharacterized protein n=1 Tax=Batillaria attramentaria TaxID=370345 RepID=A0ABD0K3H1_9CAEN